MTRTLQPIRIVSPPVRLLPHVAMTCALLFSIAACAQDRAGTATAAQPGKSEQPQAPEANPVKPIGWPR